MGESEFVCDTREAERVPKAACGRGSGHIATPRARAGEGAAGPRGQGQGVKDPIADLARLARPAPGHKDHGKQNDT